MTFEPFVLERYFAAHEFTAPYLLCVSDCESHTVSDVLALEPESRERLLNLGLGYTPSEGTDEFRDAVATLYGETIGRDQVISHVGAEEAIFTFMHGYLEPGDHVVVQTPCYQSHTTLPKSIGCEISEWPLRLDANNRWISDIDALSGLLKANTKLVVINHPHNPTGHVMPPGAFSRMVSLLREREIVLLSDEVYRGLERVDESPAAADGYEHGVSVNVLSKSFGLPGLRAGWLASGRVDLLEKAAAVKDYTSICSPAPSEFLGAIACRNADHFINASRSVVDDNLTQLDAFFAKHADTFTWTNPDGGPIGVALVNGADDAEPFCDALREEAGVLLMPGKYLDMRRDAVRFGFGRKNMKESLDRLSGWLEKR